MLLSQFDGMIFLLSQMNQVSECVRIFNRVAELPSPIDPFKIRRLEISKDPMFIFIPAAFGIIV